MVTVCSWGDRSLVLDRPALLTTVVHKVIDSRGKPMYRPKLHNCGCIAKGVTWYDFRSCSYVDMDPAAESAPI